MKSKFRLAALATASLLALPLAATGTPGGSLNLHTQNQGLGEPAGSGTRLPDLVASGRPLPGITTTFTIAGATTSSPSNPPSPPPGNESGTQPPKPPGTESQPVFSLNSSGIENAETFNPSGAQIKTPNPETQGQASDPTKGSDSNSDSNSGPGNDSKSNGSMIDYLILESRPDFRLQRSLRLFEPQTTSQGGQDSLGVAPALSETSRRFVPLGEF